MPEEGTLEVTKEFTFVHKICSVLLRGVVFQHYSNYNYKMGVLEAQAFIHNLGQIPPWKSKDRLKTTANSII